MNYDNKLCKDLLGIHFTSPDCVKDVYIHAFSFQKEVLKNMITANIPEGERSYYSIGPIKLYIYRQFPKSKVGNIMFAENYEYKEIEFPVYGFNLLTFNPDRSISECTQILLSTKYITEYMKNTAGISSVPIQIDTFYEESILNA